jgi:hypothetical protein
LAIARSLVDDVAAVAAMEAGIKSDDPNLEAGLDGRGIVIEDAAAADGGIPVLGHYAQGTETEILGAVLVEEE